MTAIHWKSGISGNFDDASKWITATVPSSFDDALIDASGTYTVESSRARTVHSLTMVAGATLEIVNGEFDLDFFGADTNNGTIHVYSDLAVFGALNNTGVIDFFGGPTPTVSPHVVGYLQPTGTSTSSGKIEAINDAEISFNINPVAGPVSFTNNGIIEAIGGSIITIGGTFVATSSFTNVGTIEALGQGSVVDLFSAIGAITNSGHLVADGGTIQINNPNSVSGSGTAEIRNGGTLFIGASFAENTTFDPGANGILQLGFGAAFTGTLSGFTTGDRIDFSGLQYSGSTLKFDPTTDALNVSNGSSSTTIHLSGSYVAGGFNLSADASGYAQVTYAPSLTANHSPLIDAAQSVLTATISKASTSGIDSARGIVAFDDQDLSDRPEPSIVSKTVIAKDAYGTIDTLTDAQTTLLKQAFMIAPEAGNTNNGAIDWKFGLPNQSLSFLSALDTSIRLTAVVQIDDLHGGTVLQTVIVDVVFDPYISYVDANPGHATPADVVRAAVQYQNSLWNSDNCTGLVWAVTEAVGQPFGEKESDVPGFTSDPTHIPDQGFVIPPNVPTQYGPWLTVQTSDWRSIVQPGDLVRIPATNVARDALQEGHSFIVISKDGQGNWLVIDNTDPNHLAGSGAGPVMVSEHAFNPGGQFGREVLNADVAYVSRLETGPSSSFTGTTVTGTPGQALTYGNAAAFLDGSKLQNQSITAGNGNDFVTAGSNDVITLGQGRDVVQGGNIDTIAAGNGNDTVLVGFGNTISLGNGIDTIVAGSNSTIVIGNGNDTISVGLNSTVKVGNGNDSIAAGAGSMITLGNGTDTVKAISSVIQAGAGSDTFVFVGDFGQSTITNFNLQKDVIEFDGSHFANAAAVLSPSHASQHGADVVIADGHGNSVTLTGLTITQLQAHQNDFHLI
ncbi:hypothetical protein ABIB99_007397 [Bradyrhizobium sp. LA6.1]|uniref:hypothetical protein n=1 Tax=Bradyrhizobium sp. LA6.1 TaxID=3156378 RepID=UPI0033983800